jgi:hypothetical protein
VIAQIVIDLRQGIWIIRVAIAVYDVHPLAGMSMK